MLYGDPSASPLQLLSHLVEKYKYDWITLDMEALLDTLKEEESSVHPLVQERIRALRTLHLTEAPWCAFENFSPVVQALNGLPVNFEVLVPSAAHELALTMFVMNLVRPQHEYADEVARFLAACLMYQGIHIIPITYLNVCQKHLRPHNTSAQALFDQIKDQPIASVEVDTSTNDGIQALSGKLELETYKDTLRTWRPNKR